MANDLKLFARSVERIDWNDAEGKGPAEAADLLDTIGPERLCRIAFPAMDGILTEEAFEASLHGSSLRIRRTPTHIKFLLHGEGGHASSERKVWGHAWLGEALTAQTGPCYAEIKHKHRYGLAAKLARLSYNMSTLRYPQGRGEPIAPNGLWIPDAESWAHPVEEVFGQDNPVAWSLGPLDIHSITPERGAFSVVVQGPKVVGYSHTFKEIDGELVVTAIPDLPTRLPSTIEGLRAAAQAEAIRKE